MSETDTPDLTGLTVQLLSAYVANNTVPSNELSALIQSTRQALASESAEPKPEQPEYIPATTVRKSLASREHILSLIDGKPYKTLKRHLASHGLTPAEYRTRYNLPNDYPMVAVNYAEHRREVAKRVGLGRKKDVAAPVPAASVEAPAVVSAPEPAAKPARKAKTAKEAKPATAEKKPAAAKGRKPATATTAETPAPAKRGRPPRAKTAETTPAE